MLQVAVADSLPLMGIENPRTSSGFPPAEYRSLPLMGIENPDRLQAFPRSRPANLITPHGDRKPGDCNGLEEILPSCSWPHYPSWGSKTRADDDPARSGS